ncbi:oxidative stress transcriptional regulator AosR [Mycobacterium sp.]|uniref:oxidative stress transcriptional regulator AosR n=1 Tax=Mycobacterium sp. TaxID=1785 RepID=UPI003F949AF7
MRKWKRVETAGGTRFRSALDSHEAALLKNLVVSMVGLLDERESSSPPDELEQITGMKTGNSERPDNPTLQRLLPDFSNPDDAAPLDEQGADSLNAALRSLHEPSIIDAKRVAAQQLLDTLPDEGGRFELTEEAANAWVAAVNDVRLALGTMLDIRPDGPDRLPDDHPLAPHLDVYQWLTVLQEYLVLALMGSK